MRFLFKLLALLFGFAVVGLIGLSVISVLFAIGIGASRGTVVPGVLTVGPNSTVIGAEVEHTPERAPRVVVRPESAKTMVVPAPVRPDIRVSMNDGPAQQSEHVALAAVFLALPLLVVIGFFCLAALALRMVNNRVRGSSGPSSVEEARMMQEIHRGMARFEQRIQSLETILLDGAGYHTGVKD